MNANKSNAQVLETDGILQCNVSLDYGKLEVLGKFRYLRVKFSKDGSKKDTNESRVTQGRNNGGTLKALMNRRKLSMECAKKLARSTCPNSNYGCETQDYIGKLYR